MGKKEFSITSNEELKALKNVARYEASLPITPQRYKAIETLTTIASSLGSDPVAVFKGKKAELKIPDSGDYQTVRLTVDDFSETNSLPMEPNVQAYLKAGQIKALQQEIRTLGELTRVEHDIPGKVSHSIKNANGVSSVVGVISMVEMEAAIMDIVANNMGMAFITGACSALLASCVIGAERYLRKDRISSREDKIQQVVYLQNQE